MKGKGQGSLEYLFMIAAALIIIFVVVHYLGENSVKASEQSQVASLQARTELAKSSLQAKGFWNDEHCFYILSTSYAQDKVGSEYGISIKDKGPNGECNQNDKVLYYVDYSYSEYRDEIKALYGDERYKLKTLKELYDLCLANDERACKIIIALGESLWVQHGQS